MPNLTPSLLKERADILDILRGIALLGIIIANFPVLSLWNFQPDETRALVPFPLGDKILDGLIFTFIDGKFYSLFSLLFGIGFSIIIIRCQNSGRNGLYIFYRRLIILIMIGLAHALFLWIGDILLLYALIGLFLPLFRNVSDKGLIITAICLILSPLLFDVVKVLTHFSWDLSAPVAKKGAEVMTGYGITPATVPTWLSTHDDYRSMLQFNHSGMFFRWDQILASNRIPKVLAMFLLGLYTGRKMIYARLEENRSLLLMLRKYGFWFGLPLSFVYAWLELEGPSYGSPYMLFRTLAYALSVIPLSLAYTASICLWFMKNPGSKFLRAFAAPGRMALTNYLMHSVAGILLFYAIGLGLGPKIGLINVTLLAAAVYSLYLFLSKLWLRSFAYGPAEWIWRQLTYGKFLPLRKREKTGADAQ